MKRVLFFNLGSRRAGVPLLACALLAGCLGTAPVRDESQVIDLDATVAQVAESLVAQLKKQSGVIGQLTSVVTTAVGKPKIRPVVVDPMIDGASGQHTVLSAEFERRLVAKLAATHPELPFVPISPEALKQAELLMVGTIALESAGAQAGVAKNAPARAQVAIVALKSGTVLAQANARARNTGFDITPGGFEQDSPVVMVDPAVQGYIRSAALPPDQVADETYLKQLTAATLIAQGTEAYNQARYPDSLKHFQSALSDPQGEQMRALNGSYLSNVKLGKMDQAEQVFGRIVSLGIANRNLGVKFLFNPGSTDFWSDTKVSGQYDIWLRQVARGIERTDICVEVLGHASRTGTENFNDKLSEQRAARIRLRLVTEAPKLTGRVTTKGVGARENIVGTGTDDVRDAVDRRVGFKFQNCPAA